MTEALNLWTDEVSGSVTVIFGDFCGCTGLVDSGPMQAGAVEPVPLLDPKDEVTGLWEDDTDGEVGGSGDMDAGG